MSYLRAIFPRDPGYTEASGWSDEPELDVLELSRKPRGQKFVKEILRIGKPFLHPGNGSKIVISRADAEKLVENFNDRSIVQHVAYCTANSSNAHDESPERVAGVVTNVRIDGDRVLADLDVRKADIAQGIKDGTVLEASAFLSLNGKHPDTGDRVGPVLFHVAATSRPALNWLSDYEIPDEVAATAWADPEGSELVMLTAWTDAGLLVTREGKTVALVPQANVAYRKLADAGLVEIVRGRGVFVRP